MSTPSIQTLITQAQQVLNLKSSNEIRATLAAILANANVGTPLNPNLTTQQLWDEFYEIVRQPSDDIMSIITDQMMRMVFSPPAPGGAGADKQVIFNDGGVLAGDPDLIFNKALNKLVANNIETAAGLLVGTSATITGDLTVDTSTLKVDSTNDRVGIKNASPNDTLTIAADNYLSFQTTVTTLNSGRAGRIGAISAGTGNGYLVFETYQGGSGGGERYRIASDGVSTWSVAGTTAMTLNSTGLGIGDAPASGEKLTVLGSIYLKTANKLKLDNASNNFGASIHNIGASAQAALAFTLGATQAMTLDATGNLILGTTATYNSSRLTVQGASGNGGVVTAIQNDNDSYYAINFRNSSGTSCGSISCTTSLTSFNVSSDYRLKEAIQPLTGGLTRVNALKPSIYKWKVNGSTGEGFIAHELADVVPFAVTGDKDAVDADGQPTYQGVDLSKIIPILVAAIQELTAEVNALKNA
jgi:hypothetical protein